jgi:cell division inhibitor SulA
VGNEQKRLFLTAEWFEVGCVFLDQAYRLKAVNNMGMRTSLIVVIRMGREIVVMVMVQCQLMRGGHVEVVMRGHARTGDGHQEYLRAKEPDSQ